MVCSRHVSNLGRSSGMSHLNGLCGDTTSPNSLNSPPHHLAATLIWHPRKGRFMNHSAHVVRFIISVWHHCLRLSPDDSSDGRLAIISTHGTLPYECSSAIPQNSCSVFFDHVTLTVKCPVYFNARMSSPRVNLLILLGL